MLFGNHIRSLLRALTSREMRVRLYAAKHRIWWKRNGGKWAMEHSGRKDIVDALVLLCKTLHRDHVIILEFGCSAGSNSRLLRAALDIPVSYYGVDISESAIAMACRAYPESEFLVCDDLAFPKLARHLGHFDVFLAVGVFYYIPPERALALLVEASCLADYIVLCDDMSQFDGSTADIDGLFVHPYSALCREARTQRAGPPCKSELRRSTRVLRR